MSALWVPGELTPTNRALSDQRAVGFALGLREGLIRAGRWKEGGAMPVDRYAEAAAATRRRTAFAARAARVPFVGPDERVRLRVSVQGFPRWDASGAFLAAKWSEDGLVDAGVLRSDRHNVAAVEVTVVQRPELPDPPAGVLLSWEVVR